MKPHVGFIGLGNMGKWMALNVIKSGYPLRVFDLRKEPLDMLVKQGAAAANDPSEIAAQCEIIVFCLPDTPTMAHILFGPEGLAPHLGTDTVIIDTGTTSPLFTREASKRFKNQGVAFLDAPVSGMETRAKDASLTLMIGGDEAAFHRVHPLMTAVGNNIFYMGESGNGQLAKMANNVLFNISCAAMAEVLPMAVKMGLDPEKLCAVVRSGTGQSYGFDFFSKLVLEDNFEPGYPLKNAYKDMDAVIELAAKHRIPLPVTAATMQTYQMALCQGYGNENKGAMIKVWENLLKVKTRKG